MVVKISPESHPGFMMHLTLVVWCVRIPDHNTRQFLPKHFTLASITQSFLRDLLIVIIYFSQSFPAALLLAPRAQLYLKKWLATPFPPPFHLFVLGEIFLYKASDPSFWDNSTKGKDITGPFKLTQWAYKHVVWLREATFRLTPVIFTLTGPSKWKGARKGMREK
jgi:hypothetical protein